jgi:hypothetical protein
VIEIDAQAERAWDALGDQLDIPIISCANHRTVAPQLQEALDVLTVWEHIKEHGGKLCFDGAILNMGEYRVKEFNQYQHDGGDWLHKAAEWVWTQAKGKRDE